eukprot:5063955-Pyramimonas_sp.AAC.1
MKLPLLSAYSPDISAHLDSLAVFLIGRRLPVNRAHVVDEVTKDGRALPVLLVVLVRAAGYNPRLELAIW